MVGFTPAFVVALTWSQLLTPVSYSTPSPHKQYSTWVPRPTMVQYTLPRAAADTA